MLIVCPSCASEYVIDTDRVGAAGRSVRCAACRETWFITPDAVAAALAEEIAELQAAMGATEGRAEAQAEIDAWEAALSEEDPPEPESDAREPPTAPLPHVQPARTRRGFAGLSTAAALGLALLAGLPLAVIGRSTVVKAMPQSASLYARIGLPVNLRGLELRELAAYQTQGEGAQGQLVVEGDVVGIASGGTAVPPIEVEVRDAQDQTLYRWTVPAPRPALEPRETARFRASLSAPPAEARSVQVRFAPQVALATSGDPKSGDSKPGVMKSGAEQAPPRPNPDASRRNP